MSDLESKKISSKINKFYFITIIFIILSFSSYLFYKYDNLMQYNEKIKQINKEINAANKKNEELKISNRI